MLLCSERFLVDHGDRLREIAGDLSHVPLVGTEPPPDLAGVTLAFLSNDMWPAQAPSFCSAVAQAPDLQWVHVMFAGVDHPIFGKLAARGVRVTTSAGASAPAIAETVLLYLSALTRELPAHLEGQRGAQWEFRRWRPLAGRSMAVVGYGPVGQRIAIMAEAVGLVPTVVRRRVRGDEPYTTRTLSELRDVAATHDVFVLALPLHRETQGVVSRDVIEVMPPDSIFINVARGKLVDEEALSEALAQGRIAGAGLDVFIEEPLPPENPLWQMPNVIITPHNSGASTQAPARVREIFFQNLELWLRGEPLLNEVG